jgi:hypothetical protein
VLTAGALLVVPGAALLMDVVCLSMAMAAFLAGVMLSSSSYRHQIESDIVDLEDNEIATSQFTVDREIEQREITDFPVQLQSRARQKASELESHKPDGIQIALRAPRRVAAEDPLSKSHPRRPGRGCGSFPRSLPRQRYSAQDRPVA